MSKNGWTIRTLSCPKCGQTTTWHGPVGEADFLERMYAEWHCKQPKASKTK